MSFLRGFAPALPLARLSETDVTAPEVQQNIAQRFSPGRSNKSARESHRDDRS